MSSRSKVIILGAGISGITAAWTLEKHNITDFVVLEAQDYIGGRVKSINFKGVVIETGANWIHHAHDSDSAPLLKLKKQVNLKGKWSNYSDVVVRSSNGHIKPHNDIMSKFQSILQAATNEKSHEDIHSSFRSRLSRNGWENNTVLANIIEYFYIDFTCSREPDTVSFCHLVNRENDFFVSDPHGLSSLFQSLYKGFINKIELGRIVNAITYNDEGVRVYTTNGKTFLADYVICTFSSDVILSNLVAFYPPLPKWKLNAFAKMPLSLYTKIFLKFPYQFWDEKEYILHESAQRGYFPVFQNFQIYCTAGLGILLITVTGQEALRVERQSIYQTQDQIMVVLRKLYWPEIPEPLGIYYDRWSQNPFTQGAYSEAVLGTTTRDFQDMVQNVSHLYFAGEATSEKWYGYMQGAFITGRDVAMEIVKKINKKSWS
ncbi:polyamine oxidase 1-like [Actinia tenebrosa]|uniref:Amine oxidase n=1 Tax=Actinia tenebrosa TaxID=6105 RepID=A0A6P8I2A4_ACTTE|nr:polyamine oxidase 1-like [Actinia tenebrosa]